MIGYILYHNVAVVENIVEREVDDHNRRNTVLLQLGAAVDFIKFGYGNHVGKYSDLSLIHI